MQLCPNRPWDGSSGFSHMYDGDLTTCFEDVILLPISVWILLLLSPAAVISALAARRNGAANMGLQAQRRWWWILYNGCCICIIGMSALEMARLSRAHFGIGLLPFVPVGAAIAIALNLLGGATRETSLVLFLFWTIFSVFEAVKLHTLARIDHEGYKRTASQYKTYDQLTDNVVILCIGVILAVMSILTPTLVGVRRVPEGASAGGEGSRLAEKDVGDGTGLDV